MAVGRILTVVSVLVLAGSLTSAYAGAQPLHRMVNAHTASSVRLCVSVPAGVPVLRDASRAIEDGVILATEQHAAAFRALGVHLQSPRLMDDAAADRSNYSPEVENKNAARCAADSTVMGYVGPLNSDAAFASEPVLNRARMATISPSNTAIALTSAEPWAGLGGRAALEPDTFSHQIPWVTYYRNVPNDFAEGPAAALYAHTQLRARSVYVVDDILPYGSTLASTFTEAGRSLGMTVIGSGHIDASSSAAQAKTAQQQTEAIAAQNPDLVYCGCDAAPAIALARRLRAAGYTRPFLGADPVQDAGALHFAGASAAKTIVTDPALAPLVTSISFRRMFRNRFHIDAGDYAAAAYDAAGILLTATYEAALQGQLQGSVTTMREAVVANVAAIHYAGATGKIAFDANGDTTNRLVTVYAFHHGNWVARAAVRLGPLDGTLGASPRVIPASQFAATPSPPSLRINSLRPMNARSIVQKRFKAGDTLHTVIDYSVQGAQIPVLVRVRQAYQYHRPGSGPWLSDHKSLQLKVFVSNGTGTLYLGYTVPPSVAHSYSQMRITVTMGGGVRAATRSTLVQIR